MGSRIYGYARISTKDQKLDRQIDALRQYVPDERNIICEVKSGKDFSRPQYIALKESMLREGDTLFIEDLDRLGRNKREIKRELEELRQMGVIVKILNVPTTLEDFSKFGPLQKGIFDMVNNILIEVLGTMAEQELTIKKQRQHEGIAAAKARGKHLGRPVISYPQNWLDIYTRWKQHKITAKTAMETMNLKRTTFYSLVKKHEMTSQR